MNTNQFGFAIIIDMILINLMLIIDSRREKEELLQSLILNQQNLSL